MSGVVAASTRTAGTADSHWLPKTSVVTGAAGATPGARREAERDERCGRRQHSHGWDGGLPLAAEDERGDGVGEDHAEDRERDGEPQDREEVAPDVGARRSRRLRREGRDPWEQADA